MQEPKGGRGGGEGGRGGGREGANEIGHVPPQFFLKDKMCAFL